MRAFRLPVAPRGERPHRFGTVPLSVAELDREEIRDCMQRLRGASTALRSIDLRERCQAIAAAAQRFCDPADALRIAAERELPGLTGFSVEMIREGLGRVFGALRSEALEARAREAGEAHRLIAIVSAGNLPGVALPKMALALAAGSACLVKTASGEPRLAVLFAGALAQAEPALGDAVAVTWWPGGRSAWESELAAAVDSLIAYGSDEAIEALRGVAPPVFVGHGHRLSVGVLRLDRSRVNAAAAAAAIDVALYDQLGCLSPQCLFVVSSAADRRAFVEALAFELERLAGDLPRGFVPEGSLVAIRRLRDEIEWRAIGGEPVALRPDRGPQPWMVVGEVAGRFRPSPLYRTVLVVALEHPGKLGEALGDVKGQVECVGSYPYPDDEILRAVSGCGIPNLVALGEMQRPGLEWRQGGRAPVEGIRR